MITASDNGRGVRQPSEISSKTLEMVARLGMRSKIINKALYAISGGLIAAGFAALVLTAIAAWWTPSASLTGLDVPSIVTQRFEAAAQGLSDKAILAVDGSISVDRTSASEEAVAVTTLVRNNAPILFFVIVGVSLLGALAHKSFSPLILGTAVGGAVSVSLYIAATVVGSIATDRTHPPATPIGPATVASEFRSAIKKQDLQAILSAIYRQRLDQTPSGAYVLAQVTLLGVKRYREDRKDGVQAQDLNRVVTDLARIAGESESGFTPDSQTLYAIQTQILGRAVAPDALLYAQHRESREEAFSKASVVASWLTLIMMALLGSASVFSWRVNSRLRRVLSMIAPYTYRRKNSA